MVMYGGTVILLTAVLGTAGLAFGRRGGVRGQESSVSENGTAVIAEHLTETVTAYEKTVVEGIDITGKSRGEAETLLKEKMKGLSVVWQDETVSVEEVIGDAVAGLLDKIYGDGQMKSGTFTLDTDSLKESFTVLAKKLAGKWNRGAVDSQLASFDKETGIYTYSEAKAGSSLNEDELVQSLMEAVKAGTYDTAVIPEFTEISPKRTAAQAKEQYQVIGSFTTKTTNNKNRNENIRLAVEAIDGRILKPGEEFSFNLATGNRTKDKGYQPAGAYRNGVLIEEPGGGVCQVSTTLYNAIVSSGLTATERHSHSFTPSYIQPGEDAMVSFGGPDMKFVNTSSTAIAIRASFADRKLKISIVGIPILEKGVTLAMTSKKTAELDAPAPVYEEDQTLQPGEEKIVKAETKGSRWVTNMVTKKDGVVVSDEFFHNSTYRGKPATIRRNTSGVVVPATDESASGESTIASSEGETLPSGGADTPTTTAPTQPTTAQPDTVPGQGPGEQPTSAAQPTTTQAVQPEGPGGGSGNSPGQNVVPPSPLS